MQSCVKKLSEQEARKLFQQLIDAVDYCHARGVYHRDLKVSNIMLYCSVDSLMLNWGSGKLISFNLGIFSTARKLAFGW